MAGETECKKIPMNRIQQLFGPSREEIWQRLCHEMHADYIPGGFWRGDSVRAEDSGWTITLDTYFCPATKCNYTRLRAPFLNSEHFEFKIYRRGFFSDLAKRFGMEDVEVNHPEFDRAFIIKGNDDHRLRALFNNSRIREFIAAQPQIHFKVETGDPIENDIHAPRMDELQVIAVGTIKDIDRLKQLFDLFAETLDQLAQMQVASPPLTPAEARM